MRRCGTLPGKPPDASDDQLDLPPGRTPHRLAADKKCRRAAGKSDVEYQNGKVAQPVQDQLAEIAVSAAVRN